MCAGLIISVVVVTAACENRSIGNLHHTICMQCTQKLKTSLLIVEALDGKLAKQAKKIVDIPRNPQFAFNHF